MPKHPTQTQLATLSALLAISLLSCGNSDGSDIVAEVTGVGTISKSALDHWTRVELILQNEYVPKRPVPKGAIPDPPTYHNCITYLQKTARQANTPPPPPHTLKTTCENRQKEQRANTLNKLISWDWTIGRAHALHIYPTNIQIRQQLALVLKAHTLYGSNLPQYLKYTGQTMADIILRSRIQYYEEHLTTQRNHTLTTMPHQLTEAQKQTTYLNTHPNLTTKYWTTKTNCHFQYIVSACKQYKGPEPPPGGRN